MKRLAFLLLGAAVAAIAGYAGYAGYRFAPPSLPTAFRASAPVFETAARCRLDGTGLHDAAGRPADVSAWSGRVVLISFWASWCGPCRHEMPALQAVATRYAVRGLSVVGVAVDDPASARRLAREVGVGYPLLYGRSAAEELLQACSAGSQGLPMSVILDRRGRVCARHAGALDEAGFANLLRPCLEQ